MYVGKQLVIDNGDYLFVTFQWLDVIQLLAAASAEHIDITNYKEHHCKYLFQRLVYD